MLGSIAKFMSIRRTVRLIAKLWSMPRVTIWMWGNGDCYQAYRDFVRRHPKYRITKNKRWGVALLLLPDSFEEYLQGRSKQAMRTNRTRATALGYRFAKFAATDHFDEILAINASTNERQGRPMELTYLDRLDLQKYLESKPEMYGVFDASGVLKSYAYAPICGEVFIFDRLMGHSDELDNGIMYLLCSEIAHRMINEKRATGYPLWGMYDTMVGTALGLRYFKERLGFQPYTVRWLWN